MTPKRDTWESDFAYIRYLSLITGEGARQMASKRGLKEFSTGPRDWALTWDMELSVWDFQKRTGAERAGSSAAEGAAA